MTDAAGAHALARVLRDELVEPLVESDRVGRWWARAFLHARIEWVGDPSPAADQPEATDFGPAAWAGRERLGWRGRAVFVPPLDLQLAATERRGLHDRAAQIRALLR